jgi:hypothetical protein
MGPSVSKDKRFDQVWSVFEQFFQLEGNDVVVTEFTIIIIIIDQGKVDAVLN